MRPLRVVTIVLGLCLCLTSSLVYAFGPLLVGHGTGVTPGCSPPYPLSRLKQHFDVGLSNASGQASSFMQGSGVPWDLRTIYVNGSNGAGCAVGNGWQSAASPNGQWAINYVTESQGTAAGYETLFTYYVAQSDANYGNLVVPWLNNASNVNCYFNDFTLLLQKIAAADNTSKAAVVIQIEPDMWGFIEQASTGNDPTTVPMAIASSGYTAPDSTHPLASLPNNAAGLAQAYIAIKNKVNPNVVIAYHATFWSTPSDYGGGVGASQAANTTAGNQMGSFYNSLGASFDMATLEFSDMDPGYFNAPGNCNGSGASMRNWWSQTDFNNFTYLISAFNATTGKKVYIWQIPSGNTVFLAMDNSRTYQYQGDYVQELLQAGNPNLAPFITAGVIGMDIYAIQQYPAINRSVCPTTSNSDTDFQNFSGLAPRNPAPTAIPVAAQGIFPGNGTATFETARGGYDDGGYVVWQGGIYFANSPPAVCP